MKVYIDTIAFDLQKTGGISVYWYEIITFLLKDKNMDTVLIVSNKNKDNAFWSRLDLSQAKILTMNTNRYLNLNYKEPEKHIFISSYYRTSKNKNAINITLVHDFTYEIFSKGLAKTVHVWQKTSAIKNSQGVICISHNTEKDMRTFCKKIPSAVGVIHNGASNKFRVLNNDEANEHALELDKQLLDFVKTPYLLYIGNRRGYKQWDNAVELVKRLGKDYKLLSIGGGTLTEDELNSVEGLKERFLHANVKNDELVFLYNKATALLYTSAYEGFGIPIIEAQRCGCPVVAYRVSCIPEVSGDGALLLDMSQDFQVQTSQLAAFLTNQDSLKQRKEKGFENSEKFTWTQTYEGIKSFIQNLYRKL